MNAAPTNRESPTRPVQAVILAAGASSRMGCPKALLPWQDTSFLGAIVQTLRDADGGIDRIAVVMGAHFAALQPEALLYDVAAIVNPNHADGRFTSVSAAARWSLEQGPTALLVWPVDCPAVRVDTVRALVTVARREPEWNWAPGYQGRFGHPIVLCAATVEYVAWAPPESNLRAIMQPRRRMIETADAAVLDNVNTPQDYEALLARMPVYSGDRWGQP